MAILIDGKQTALKVKDRVRTQVEALKAAGKTVPTLAVVLVGDDSASAVYVNNKKNACEYVGIGSQTYNLPANATEKEVLELIEVLNKSQEVSGILVQLPLPKHICEQTVICAIDPDKDVDCAHPVNVGLLSIGTPIFKPCTPAGVIELLKEYNIDIEGKRSVVIGRSNIVGKPMAMLLTGENSTVTVCHSKTKDLASITREADILVAALGKTMFVTADMVKENAVVIDVGIHRTEGSRRLVGDVDFEAVAAKASYITPVPGGVGPMTVAMLMENVLRTGFRS